MSLSRALHLSLLLLGCRTPTARPAPPQAHASTARPDAAPRARVAIERSEDLPDDDGRAITACGQLDNMSVGPRGARGTLVLWGLRFDNEPRIGLILRTPWPGAEDGAAPDADAHQSAVLCASGTFYAQYPLAPGDPPHASRFSGRWLFDVTLRPR